MLRAAVTAVMGVAVAGGCPRVFVYSEQLNYGLEGTGLTVGGVPWDRWTGEPVLAGSRSCPTVVCLGSDCPGTEQDLVSVGPCLGDSTSAGLEVRDGCLSFFAPGVATWTIEGGACTLDGDEVVLPADQFIFRVVAADEVEARTFLAPERLALWAAGQDSYTTTGAPLPEDLGLGRDVVTAVAGAHLPIDVDLVRRVDGRRVAYHGKVRVATDPRGEHVRLEAAVPGGAARLYVADEGAHATLLVDTLDGPLRAGVVRAVGEGEVAALEVAVFWTVSGDERTPDLPVGALALVWLADGTRADAAPVVWSIVDGELELGDAVAGLDFIFGAPAPHSVAASPWRLLRPAVAQRNTPGAYSATLRATLGAHTVDVPLRYGQELEPPTAPPPAAPVPACGCGQARPDAPAPAFTLAVIAWLGRCATRGMRRPVNIGR